VYNTLPLLFRPFVFVAGSDGETFFLFTIDHSRVLFTLPSRVRSGSRRDPYRGRQNNDDREDPSRMAGRGTGGRRHVAGDAEPRGRRKARCAEEAAAEAGAPLGMITVDPTIRGWYRSWLERCRAGVEAMASSEATRCSNADPENGASALRTTCRSE
jgi:hypothetical protein